jgi:hypothetical protein
MPPTLFVKGSVVTDDPAVAQKTPISHIIDWFKRNTATNNRVLVLKSDTGSGKSTALPATLHDVFYRPGAGGIACAQPRVLNAISIVRDLVSSGHYRKLKLGVNIGWQTGPSKRESGIGLTFMTIGVLSVMLRTMTDAEICARYRFIIVDEVHESTLEQTTLLFSLKHFVRRVKGNAAAPFIILTSATFDAEKFLRYFDVYDDTLPLGGQPAFISVSGFTYPLEERFELTTTTADYMMLAAQTAAKLHIDNPDDKTNRDILIFLPGTAEIQRCAEFLAIENEKMQLPMMILSVHSESVATNSADYSAVFAPADSLVTTVKGKQARPSRRVILATNVAETGVTIPTLKYVIDSGLTRSPEFNPVYNTHALVTKAATKSMIRQRMGRANRLAPGVFVPLYPRYVFEKLEDQPPSAVDSNDASVILLSLLYEQTKQLAAAAPTIAVSQTHLDLTAINTIHPIPYDQLAYGFEKLYALGFISPISTFHPGVTLTAEDRWLDRQTINATSSANPQLNLTKLGYIAASVNRLPPESIRMILSGYAYGVAITDLVTIAAYINLDADVMKQPGKTLAIKLPDGFKQVVADDFIEGLLLWENLTPHIIADTLDDYCAEHGFSLKSIMTFLTTREDILVDLVGAGLKIDNQTDTPDQVTKYARLKHCIYDGYRCNLVTNNITTTGLAVKAPSTNPTYYVYNVLNLKMSKQTKVYVATPNKISVLDGFVSPDLTFLGV